MEAMEMWFFLGIVIEIKTDLPFAFFVSHDKIEISIVRICENI